MFEEKRHFVEEPGVMDPATGRERQGAGGRVEIERPGAARRKAALGGATLAACVLALGLLGLGCGGSGSSDKSGACDFPNDGLCIDYGSHNSTDLNALQTQVCTPNNGNWISGSCSTSNRLGTCAFKISSSDSRLLRVYTSSGATAAQAEAACTDGSLTGGLVGTWSNG